MTRAEFEARIVSYCGPMNGQERLVADLLWPVVEAAQKVERLGGFRATHYIDIIKRVNGQDVRFEGDWLKDLSRALAALAPSRGGEK